jgi:hypothetical protein
MAHVYDEIARFMKANRLDAADACREIYLTSPAEVPDPAQWRTMIVQPTRPARAPTDVAARP